MSAQPPPIGADPSRGTRAGTRRHLPSLAYVNAALIALYFAPVWGGNALRALNSSYHGLDDRVQATAAIYLRHMFDFGLEGLVRTSQVLAGVKLVVAVAFVAYLIDFARARGPPCA